MATSREIDDRFVIDFCEKSSRNNERFNAKPSQSATSGDDNESLVADLPSDSSPTLNDSSVELTADAAPSARAATRLNDFPEAENSFNVVFVFNNSLFVERKERVDLCLMIENE